MTANYSAVQNDGAGPVVLPSGIEDSFIRFRKDHPDPSHVAFIIMRFGDTPAHRDIVETIRASLGRHRITALRADEKQYHDSLFENVLTYMHGCGFGIAVFERLESESFNPNVAFEVGYMLAMQKPVCLLKDATLKSLHSDLIGRLYREFDVQRPKESILPQITAWLSDKGLGTLWGNEMPVSGQSGLALFCHDDRERFPYFGTTTGGHATMIFRSKTVADYFSQRRGFASEWEARELSALEMVKWLERARESYKVTDVAIDPDPTDSHYRAKVLPISVVIEVFNSV